MKTANVAILVLTLLLTPAWVAAEEEVQLQQPEKHHIGTVVESKTGGKYIYLKLDEEGKQTWIATMPTYLGGKAAEGDKVEYWGGVEMTDFKSKALDKTFDKIIFITKIKKLDAPKLKDFEHVPADDHHSQYISQEKSQKISPPAKGGIEKAENGKNIEEIFGEAEKLKDKEVIVKAKVIKVSKQILGKNWITLQDGTGNPPDNKLVATTQETANIGDIVTIKGILKTDVSIGSGYNYKVLIEEAVIIK